jgi:ABC-type polysaccharide/polyol phosphate export permease
VTWAIIRPLLTMVVFTIVFGGLQTAQHGTAPCDHGLCWHAAVVPVYDFE